MTWPQPIFGSPLLRGLDERGQRELSEAGRLRTLVAGELLYGRGDEGGALYVVADGAVSLSGVVRGQDRESELRRAGPGESFGEEASIGATFRASARALETSVVAELPVAVLRRALGRAGGSEVADRFERRLRRAATAELLATLAFTSRLGERDMELLLDGAEHKSFLRGDAIYRAGEAATHLWLVVDGMVQLQTDDDERLRVRAYLVRGDFFGDEEVLRREPRRESAIASGASLLIAVPADLARTVADRNPQLLRQLRRVVEEQAEVQERAARASHETRHAFRDLYRLQVARSLLVIDLGSCIRCGHCAWACESLHGVARLVRRGDKIVTRVGAEESPSPLLLPNSCQHCDNPACMPDCPTGAIGRDPRGEVFIRDALCTGCGACAKGCPWDNIQIVPRPAAAARPAGGVFEELAVKCDLCRDYAGPACVQACPTESIFRMNPSEALPEVAEVLRQELVAPLVRPRSQWPLVALAAAVGAGLAIVGAAQHARGAWVAWRGLGWALGIAAAAAFVMLLGYAAPKRWIRLWQRRRARVAEALPAPPPVRSKVRPQLTLHIGLGLASLGMAVGHGGAVASASSGGALLAAFFGCAALGILAGVSYALVPRRLARLERRAALPEDFAAARRELNEQLFGGVSGKSDVVKRLFERVLVPYLRRPLGWMFLVLSGRDLGAEARALRSQIDGLLQGRGAERLAGLDALIRMVVELRALDGQRALTRLLRMWLPLHVVGAALAAALLVIHLVEVLR